MRDTINQHGKIVKRLDTVYIGYDPRESDAVDVLIESIRHHASRPLNIVTLNQVALRRIGLYYRAPHMDSTVWAANPKNHMIDLFDQKPLSTEFSFTRFLVPFLNQMEGFAIFMDCDMLIRSDLCEIFDTFATEDAPAIRCVQHQYDEGGQIEIKMYGCPQVKYARKNWSSFMLFNCSHKGHQNLTVGDVNTKAGIWLHNFMWLEEGDVGALPEEWNWLDGHSSVNIEAKNVHFTTGGPWFETWKPKRDTDFKYAQEWFQYNERLQK